MEAAVNLFGNLSVFSVLEMIFVQQDYRTINFLSDEQHGEDSMDKMTQIASNFFKPISLSVLGDQTNARLRIGREQPILNVVVLKHLNNETNISRLRENILADDVTVVLSVRYDEYENFDVKRWMNLSMKVIILTRNLAIFFNSFESEHTAIINLSPFDPAATRNEIQKFFSEEFVVSRSSNVSIFFQFLPPRANVGQEGKNLILNGPDGTLAEILATWLKVEPIFCSDIALTYPAYEKWLDDPVIGPRLHFQFYYTKVMTKNFVKIFNKR